MNVTGKQMPPFVYRINRPSFNPKQYLIFKMGYYIGSALFLFMMGHSLMIWELPSKSKQKNGIVKPLEF
jgi:hypothetical protein